MLKATKTTHRFFTSTDNYGHKMTGSILTVHIDRLPAEGELFEMDIPAVGHCDAVEGARAWIPFDQTYAEPGTTVVTVTIRGYSSRQEYVEFVTPAEADEDLEVIEDTDAQLIAGIEKAIEIGDMTVFVPEVKTNPTASPAYGREHAFALVFSRLGSFSAAKALVAKAEVYGIATQLLPGETHYISVETVDNAPADRPFAVYVSERF